MNVDWEGLVIVIARRPIGQKERLLPVFVTLHHVRYETFVAATLSVVLETVQNIGSVEVVNPVQVFLFAVIPRAI